MEPNKVDFHSLACDEELLSRGKFRKVKLYEPFKTLMRRDDKASQAKHLRPVLVYMFVRADLVDVFTASTVVRLGSRKKGLVAIKAMKNANEYKDNYPTIKNGEVVAKLRAEDEEKKPPVNEDKVALRRAVKVINMQVAELEIMRDSHYEG